MDKPRTKFDLVHQFIQMTSRADRERHVAQIMANLQPEGLKPDKAVKRLQSAYIDGTVTLNDMLDRLKLRLSIAVLGKVDISTVRSTSLANLGRWKAQGTWSGAYDEWAILMTSGTDAEIITVMTSPDENSNRLRQSPPYVGILDQELVRRLKMEMK